MTGLYAGAGARRPGARQRRPTSTGWSPGAAASPTASAARPPGCGPSTPASGSARPATRSAASSTSSPAGSRTRRRPSPATGSAVRGYAAVLRDAQGRAPQRGDAVRAGRAGTPTRWEHADEPRIRRTTRARTTGTAPRPLLADARQRVADAGAARRAPSRRRWADAPREPHWWENAGHFVAEIGRGAWEATAGLVEFAWSVSHGADDRRPRRLADRHAGARHRAGYGVTHPVELGKVLIDWDTWQESPGRAIGHLLPDLLLDPGDRRRRGGGARGARACRRWTSSPTSARPSSGWTGWASPGSG